MTNTFAPSATILVTGGTGFAGSHLLEALIAKGCTNLHATHFGSSNQAEQLAKNVTFHQVNLTEKAAVQNLFKTLKPDYIFHLASFAAVGKSFGEADSLLQNNILLQLYVLEALREHAPTARLLTIGSAEEYGILPKDRQHDNITEDYPLNPANPYAVTKVTQDLLANTYAMAFGLDIVRARPFNHIGERQAPAFVIPAFVSQIIQIEKKKQDKLKVGNLDPVRDFTDVKDMVQAYITLMEKGQKGEVYNIGSGQGWQIRQVLDTLLGMANCKVVVEQDPTRLRPSDVPYFVANSQKIRLLGWEPKISLPDTLQRIMDEWRAK